MISPRAGDVFVVDSVLISSVPHQNRRRRIRVGRTVVTAAVRDFPVHAVCPGGAPANQCPLDDPHNRLLGAHVVDRVRFPARDHNL